MVELAKKYTCSAAGAGAGLTAPDGQKTSNNKFPRSPTILITGAGASLRGRPNTAAFAPAKAAQRMLAQSLARDLGPKGVHVGYFIIDGIVDIPYIRENWMPGKPDEFFLNPALIADAYWDFACQDRRAWTHEMDLRPHGENW